MIGARLCPICKTPMAYIQETERMGEERRILRYYKCPACGARVIDEVLRIRKVNGSVIITLEQNGSGKIIHHQRHPRRQRHIKARKTR